ncbi:MAG: hypothetical protein MUF45_05790 [Spirosomaceae bacterium]|jgi:hypothetical protein|nr:hypothetical protein [Spirosomataceae bacterium]
MYPLSNFTIGQQIFGTLFLIMIIEGFFRGQTNLASGKVFSLLHNIEKTSFPVFHDTILAQARQFLTGLSVLSNPINMSHPEF